MHMRHQRIQTDVETWFPVSGYLMSLRVGRDLKENICDSSSTHEFFRRVLGKYKTDHRAVFLHTACSFRIVNLEPDRRSGRNLLRHSRLPFAVIAARSIRGEKIIHVVKSL